MSLDQHPCKSWNSTLSSGVDNGYGWQECCCKTNKVCSSRKMSCLAVCCIACVVYVWHVGHRALGLSCHRGVWFLCCCWRPAGGSGEGETRPRWSPHWGPPCFPASNRQYLREIHWGNPTLWGFISPLIHSIIKSKEDTYSNKCCMSKQQQGSPQL